MHLANGAVSQNYYALAKFVAYLKVLGAACKHGPANMLVKTTIRNSTRIYQ
jgi:hypothetical protein